MIYDFGDAEALRLVRAFYMIEDPEIRRIIVAIAEAVTRGASAARAAGFAQFAWNGSTGFVSNRAAWPQDTAGQSEISVECHCPLVVRCERCRATECLWHQRDRTELSYSRTLEFISEARHRHARQPK